MVRSGVRPPVAILLAAVAQGHQAIRRHLAVGDDEHRRIEGDDARDAPLLIFALRGKEVGHLAPTDDLHAIRMDVVEVADEIGRASCRERVYSSV